MKKIRVAFIIVFVSLLSLSNFYGQSKFSLDANLPLPQGDAKDAEYKGVGDLGLRFTMFNISKVDFGLGINAGYFKIEDMVNTVAMRARFVGQVKVLKFEPYLGLGYGLFATWLPDNPDSSGSDSGFSMCVGVKIFPIPKLYANIGYDSTSFSEDGEDFSFNFINLGLGIEL